MRFQAFIDDIKRNQWNVFGAELYLDGELAGRYGDTAERRHPIYSATKTITSIAAGMAADDGRLDIHKSILEYLPGSVLRKMPEQQIRTYESITTERLLAMSVAGYPFAVSGKSWLEDALNCPLADVSRKEFNYSNIAAYLVGVTAACAVGEDLYQYIERRLFGPLGIVRPPFARCPDGYFYGASSMKLTVNELSRIGLLLYHGGRWRGQQIVSEEYVKAASAIQQMNREGGYGYFLWKYRNGFSINGKWQQKCYILPEEGIMVAYLSHIEEKTALLRESMERNILDADARI